MSAELCPSNPKRGDIQMILDRMNCIAFLGTGIVFSVLTTMPMPALAVGLDMNAVNKMDRTAFTKTLGGIFENSPWVAEKAWDVRPFASLDELHTAMVTVVQNAPIEQQVSLLRAHPDLAGKEAQAGALTASSTVEQASAGLNALSKEELARLSKLNADYHTKFGFPFIIAVRNHTKEGIFFEFERRLANPTDIEVANDLKQVYTITRLRLNKLFGSN
jgi:2-oxo-4-hydroxy-4-carboxy-5-ureidoimidazoline decarboxylase